MPVRPRRQRRRGEWDPAVALALTSGAAPSRPQPSTAVLREAWEEQREFLIATATDIAALRGFWMFEKVPEELREEPPVLFLEADAEAVQEARDGLLTRRRAWLLEHRPDLDRPVAGR